MDETDQGGDTARKQRWDPEEHQYTWGVMEKKLPVKESETGQKHQESVLHSGVRGGTELPEGQGSALSNQ